MQNLSLTSYHSDILRLFVRYLTDVEDIANLSLACKKLQTVCEPFWEQCFNPPFVDYDPTQEKSAKRQLTEQCRQFCVALCPLVPCGTKTSRITVFAKKKQLLKQIKHSSNHLIFTTKDFIALARHRESEPETARIEIRLISLIEATHHLPSVISPISEKEGFIPYSPLNISLTNPFTSLKLIKVILHVRDEVKWGDVKQAFRNKSPEITLLLLPKVHTISDLFFQDCKLAGKNPSLFYKIADKVETVRGICLNSILKRGECPEYVLDQMLDKYEDYNSRENNEILVLIRENYSPRQVQKFLSRFPPGHPIRQL